MKRIIKLIIPILCVSFLANAQTIKEWREPSVIKKFFPGQKVVVDSVSQIGRWNVVFEGTNDGGYFSAFDLSQFVTGKKQIQVTELLFIDYKHKNIDKNREAVAKIIWSSDGYKVCLLINEYPHAVFDFKNKRGYCRTNFPIPVNWEYPNFKWDDNILEYFKEID